MMEMNECAVELREMQEEILDMLNVCFEGTIARKDGFLELLLANGQKFRIVVDAA